MKRKTFNAYQACMLEATRATVCIPGAPGIAQVTVSDNEFALGAIRISERLDGFGWWNAEDVQVLG